MLEKLWKAVDLCFRAETSSLYWVPQLFSQNGLGIQPLKPIEPRKVLEDRAIWAYLLERESPKCWLPSQCSLGRVSVLLRKEVNESLQTVFAITYALCPVTFRFVYVECAQEPLPSFSNCKLGVLFWDLPSQILCSKSSSSGMVLVMQHQNCFYNSWAGVEELLSCSGAPWWEKKILLSWPPVQGLFIFYYY